MSVLHSQDNAIHSFCMHGLTAAHDWLVSLLLTGVRVAHLPHPPLSLGAHASFAVLSSRTLMAAAPWESNPWSPVCLLVVPLWIISLFYFNDLNMLMKYNLTYKIYNISDHHILEFNLFEVKVMCVFLSSWVQSIITRSSGSFAVKTHTYQHTYQQWTYMSNQRLIAGIKAHNNILNII